MLSRGHVSNVLVVTTGFTNKLDLIVTSLLHEVDLVLGMTWLHEVDPLIHWISGIVYILDSERVTRMKGKWLATQVKTGTIKVLSTDDELKSLINDYIKNSLQVIGHPKFWSIRGQACKNSWRSSHDGGRNGTLHSLAHPIFGVLEVKRLSNNATLPWRGTKGAAGYDLCASQNCVIPAHGKGLVSIGISIQFPKGLYARIAPRSGLAMKKYIDAGAGVIDSDYRGKIKVVLFKHGDQDFGVNMGDRIAQLIL